MISDKSESAKTFALTISAVFVWVRTEVLTDRLAVINRKPTINVETTDSAKEKPPLRAFARFAVFEFTGFLTESAPAVR
jgi:hypothetical protein